MIIDGRVLHDDESAVATRHELSRLDNAIIFMAFRGFRLIFHGFSRFSPGFWTSQSEFEGPASVGGLRQPLGQCGGLGAHLLPALPRGEHRALRGHQEDARAF